MRSKIKRIPVPLAQRLEEWLRGPLVLLVWLAAAAAAGWLFLQQPAHAPLRGWVPTTDHTLSSPIAGILQTCLVRPMQKVSAGEVVARLDSSSLAQRLEIARARTAELRAQVADAITAMEEQNVRDTRQWSVDLHRAWIHETTLALDAMQLQIDLTGDRLEANHLASQRHRLEGLESADVIACAAVERVAFAHTSATERARANADNQKVIAERLASAAVHRLRLQKLSPTSTATTLQPLQGLRAAIEVSALETAALEHERKATVVTSSVSGRVMEVLVSVGQAALAGQPIVRIASDATDRAIVFVTAVAASELCIGQKMQLVARDRRTSTQRAITAIGSRVEQLPELLWPAPTVPAWGVAVELALDDAAGLLAGEAVRARL